MPESARNGRMEERGRKAADCRVGEFESGKHSENNGERDYLTLGNGFSRSSSRERGEIGKLRVLP